MSTDRKRLTSAIQRIAREDPEIRNLLDDFRNSGGKPSESATSGSGAEDRQICCDGSSGSNPNPGSDVRDPNKNPQDGIDPDDPAKISDNLTGATDCNTGQPICFEGNDWIPPEGWDSPTDPPLDNTFVEGVYYEAKVFEGATLIDSSTLQSCREVQRFLEPYWYSLCDIAEGTTLGDCSSPPAAPAFICGAGSGATDVVYCDDTPNPICDEPPPRLKSWPSDSCVNLAIKGGQLVGSKYDPENDGSWSAPRDEVELCDAFGNKFKLKASGSIEGGWKSISSQNPDDGYLYNAQGEQIARISGSEYADPSV